MWFVPLLGTKWQEEEEEEAIKAEFHWNESFFQNWLIAAVYAAIWHWWDALHFIYVFCNWPNSLSLSHSHDLCRRRFVCCCCFQLPFFYRIIILWMMMMMITVQRNLVRLSTKYSLPTSVWIGEMFEWMTAFIAFMAATYTYTHTHTHHKATFIVMIVMTHRFLYVCVCEFMAQLDSIFQTKSSFFQRIELHYYFTFTISVYADNFFLYSVAFHFTPKLQGACLSVCRCR